jgi:hypothetical protein
VKGLRVLKTGREKFTSLSQRKGFPKFNIYRSQPIKNKPTNNGGEGMGRSLLLDIFKWRLVCQFVRKK